MEVGGGGCGEECEDGGWTMGSKGGVWRGMYGGVRGTYVVQV